MSLEFVLDHTERRDAEPWDDNRGNWAVEGGDNPLARSAIAPAEAAGAQKFDGMFKRNSPDVAWKVAFNTMRKSRMGDSRIPSGFPQLWVFFHEARSIRVFQWGLRKYKELYADNAHWTQWTGQPSNLGQWHPQKLRVAMWTHCDRAQRKAINDSTKKPYTVTAVQQQIIAWTMRIGLWNDVPLEAAPAKIRALRNWARIRTALRAVGFVRYVARQLGTRPARISTKRSCSPSLCSRDTVTETAGDSDMELEGCSSLRGVYTHPRAACMSPSLKRVRV